MSIEIGKRYLIIHADDGGLCRSVNLAIVKSLEDGIVSSCSLMAPAPQFENMAAYFTNNSQYDVGIHLTLTCEYPHFPWGPVAGKEKVPSLVNSNGHFWYSVEEFIAHASPEDVATELQAQIEKCLQSGLKPSHLDSHMGTVFMDLRFIEIYVQLGMQYQITPMLVKPTEHSSDIIERFDFDVEKEAVDKLMKMGIPFLNLLYMTDNSTESLQAREEEYLKVVKNLPAGVSQIIIHPGYDDDELKSIMENSQSREYDFSVFVNNLVCFNSKRI